MLGVYDPMNTLKLNTTPVLKRNSITEVRTDGECFSFTFTCDDIAFQTTCRLFGNEVAQERVLKKLLDSWPTRDNIVIEHSKNTTRQGLETMARRKVERKAKK